MTRRNKVVIWSAITLAAAASVGGVYVWRTRQAPAPVSFAPMETPAPATDPNDPVQKAMAQVQAKADTMSTAELGAKLAIVGDPEVTRLTKELANARAEHERAIDDYRSLQGELIRLTRDEEHPDQKKVDAVNAAIAAMEGELVERTREVQDIVMVLGPAYQKVAFAKLEREHPEWKNEVRQ